MESQTSLVNDNDYEREENEESPEERASCLSRLFFCWMFPPLFRGWRSPLMEKDVLPIRTKWKSEYLQPRWEEQWARSIDEFSNRRSPQVGEYRNLNENSEQFPSFIVPLMRMFRWKILSVTGIRVLHDFIQFTNPIMLKLLIDFVSEGESPIGHGIALAIGIFTLTEIRSLLFNHFFTVMATMSVQVQSVLTNAVYAKALRLSISARNNRTVGAIVNLMAIDIEKICALMPVVQHYWSSPLQIAIAMGLLWWTIGLSAIAGIAIMLLMVPINYYSSVCRKNWQIAQMKVKDERTKICTEVLNGIKLIKLYAWEEAFEEKISELRKREVHYLRRIGSLAKFVDTLNAAAPFLVAVASFSLFILTDDTHVLTPQIAFVCLTIFNQIRSPMRIIAALISMTVQASVSNRRLKEFLSAEERVGIAYGTPTESFALEMHSASWGWKTGQTNLSSLTFRVRTGSMTAIVGSVGSGKSSILSAIIGDMDLQKGSIALSGRIAYVPQQAWLINGTLKDNILFGREFDERRYNEIVSACELLADLSILTNGDRTLVGENGVTLSGGQKARVSLARALYQECAIYLLDDPLSAVDAHVGEAIYEKVLSPRGLLRNRTRILVTHGLHYTKEAFNILVLRDGCIVQQGTYEELEQTPGVFRSLLDENSRDEDKSMSSSSSEDPDESEEDNDEDDKDRTIGRKKTKSPTAPESNVETVEVGKVKMDVWCSLMKAAKLRNCIPFFMFFIAHFGFQIGRNLWLSEWSEASSKGNGTDEAEVRKRLEVYSALGLIEVIAIFGGLHFLILAGQQASINIHTPMLHAILRSPIQFFDVTPVGRILNRLTRELDVIDASIPINVRELVYTFLQVFAIILVISYSIPLIIAAVIPLAVVYYFLVKVYIPTGRQLRRLESTARSPILSVFAESIHGVSSIRAYDKISSFCTTFSVHVDKFAKTRYYLLLVNRWVAVYQELLGNFIILFASLFAVISSRYFSLSPGLVGLSVSNALMITEMMNVAVRMLSETEMNAVSVERVMEYTKMESEDDWQSPLPPHEEWPVEPSIECHRLSVRYRPSLPLVLHGIAASIRAGEKVAVVGRTGSGKSSLTLALFRMIEPAEGFITLDGIDTSLIGLHELRRKLAIIPQDPVLFSGSLRFNLDPFTQYSDEQLWTALELCQLKEFASTSPGQLEYQIAEGGKNISVGQKQLVCLARVLLKKANVLVLDEATASVDSLTDSLVQTVVREQFADATVISIAHRLHTVAGYDRIMVLEKGQIVEFDTPSILLSDKSSRYSRMLEKSKHSDSRKK